MWKLLGVLDDTYNLECFVQYGYAPMYDICGCGLATPSYYNKIPRLSSAAL